MNGNPALLVNCDFCDLAFQKHQCEINRGKGKFCSIICQANARRRGMEEFRRKLRALVHEKGLHRHSSKVRSSY